MTDLETRLRADLPRLADHLLDGSESTDRAADDREDERDRGIDVVALDVSAPPASARRSRRWVRAAAAAAAVVVVIGTVAVIARRGDVVDEVQVGDQPVASTPTESSASLPALRRFAEASGPITVSISVFSGRPDPHFTPTEAEQAQLLDILNDLEAPDAASPTPPDQLGFRGFAIAGIESGHDGGRYGIDVWGTTVMIAVFDPTTGAFVRSTMRRDPTGTISDLLLDMAGAHQGELTPEGDLHADFIEGLRAQLPR